jgi:glycosyltransferase involved in cell wall biosynthesis
MKEKKSTHKTKIAFVIDQLGTGGTERQLKLLAEGLDRDRFEPSLYLLRGERDHPLKPAGIPCNVLGIHSIGSLNGLRKIWAFSRMLRAEGCNVVHTFFQDAALCGAMAGRLARADRILVSIRDMLFWADPASIRPLRLAIKLSHEVLVNSNAVRDKVLHLTGKKPVQVIHNGIETGNGFLNNKEAKQRVAEEFGFDIDSPVVVMVSNCNRAVKRVDLLIEAAPHVLKDMNTKFLIVGDGYLRADLEHLAADLGVGDNIIFAGSRNDVYSILAGSDVFLNTSASEGLSNSIMEAMRAGLPVVASDVAGNRELISHGENGLLFEPGNAQHLAEEIVFLLKDPDASLRMGKNSRQVVEDQYSISTAIKKHENIYALSNRITDAKDELYI